MNSTTARLGGDEFVVLLETLRDGQDAVAVADRIHQALKQPFLISGHEVVTTSSVGIAIAQSGSHRPEDLLRDADTALYEA